MADSLFKLITFYDLLGLTEKATSEDVILSYRKSVAAYHPDTNNAPNAERITALLNEAKSTLTDAETRKQYDQYVRHMQGEGVTLGSAERSYDLAGELRAIGLDVIDKRESGGCLWIVGDLELQEQMEAFQAHGFIFTFAPEGGKATKRRPAWYMRPNRDAI
jgi:curved DNA-binding protein CbpA